MFNKAYVLGFLAYLLNTNSCVLLVLFLERTFHENKDRAGGAKGSGKRIKD